MIGRKKGNPNNCKAPLSREAGVALAIVVWFIAGMSLLVAGIVAQARVDTQLAQIHADRARVTAAGDGAIRLAVASLEARSASRAAGQSSNRQRFRVGEYMVEVQMYSSDGFINVNEAEVRLLRELFVVAAGLPAADANRLAQGIEQWRKSRPRPRAPLNRFEAPEDLLRVPGIKRAVFDAVRDYIVAGAGSSTLTSPKSAPPEVRRILQAAGVATEQVRGQQLDVGEANLSGRGIRADAIILAGGRTWLRRQWLTQGGSERSALPWSPVRVEPPRVMQATVNRT